VKPARTLLLDNEAVQALAEPTHRKHRRVLAAIEAAANRNLRRAGSVAVVVPAAVQVEAGWNRSGPRTAALNRLRAERPGLNGETADAASSVVSTIGVSVADAHLAVSLTATPGPHSVLTSDEPDVRRAAERVGVPVTVVRV
jgi:hypothetical protein